MSPKRTSSPSPAVRKALPIKLPDGQPLSRLDIQFDLLDAIFTDSHSVFTNPFEDPAAKITFRDLYINSILNSPKATKVLKDKMVESPLFAVDFAMLALLVNVGRVNTTMSFFPGMKTTIRTYHPIPALSRTDGNLQDAPRIKHVLKSCLLGSDAKNTPATPSDIAKVSKCPSTSVTNLIFVLAHHSGPIGQTHFDGQFNFLDIFLRTDTSSKSRARIFLWLCYRYLETPPLSDDPPSPFSDSYDAPDVIPLTPEQVALENQDTPDDAVVTARLLNERNRVVLSQSVKDAMKESAKASMNGSVVGNDEDEDAVSVDGGDEPAIKTKGKKVAASSAARISTSPAKGSAKRLVNTPSSKDKKVVSAAEKKPTAMLIPDLDEDDKIDAFVKQRPASLRSFGSEPFQHPSVLFSTIPTQLMSRVASSDSHSHARYSPYPRHSPSSSSSLSDSRPRYQRTQRQPRSMFQQAWHTITSTDPLVDSDDESGGDAFMRDEYLQRLDVIKRFSQQPWSQAQPRPSEMKTES